MERNVSLIRLEPHALPHLEVGKVPDENGKAENLKTTVPAKQRIGTPVPQKKSPIPEDFDVGSCGGRRGNPTIKIEAEEVGNARRLADREVDDGMHKVRLVRKP